MADLQDLYLYYFLLRYPGRSIIFVGSIDGIRRLTPLFEMLQMPVWPLHSQLQQKQRLKNLDRYVAVSCLFPPTQMPSIPVSISSLT